MKAEDSFPSEEVLAEGFERVYDAIDQLIAEDNNFRYKNYFVDIDLILATPGHWIQHSSLRDRDEDVYQVETPNKYHGRILPYKKTHGENLADRLMVTLSDALGAIERETVEVHFVSPSPFNNEIDTPKIGDVIVTIRQRNPGFPIQTFLVHQDMDIAERCKTQMEWIKRA